MNPPPELVAQCVDADTRAAALAVYASGTLQQRNAALLRCAEANERAARDRSRAERVAEFDRFLDYALSSKRHI